MKKWQVTDLNLTVDGVLRGQGADPDIIRSRSPGLVTTAEQALAEAANFLKPEVLTKEFKVIDFQHNGLVLEGGKNIIWTAGNRTSGWCKLSHSSSMHCRAQDR